MEISCQKDKLLGAGLFVSERTTRPFTALTKQSTFRIFDYMPENTDVGKKNT